MPRIELDVRDFQRQLALLQRSWNRLPARIGDKVFQQAQGKALTPVAQQIRKNVRQDANDDGFLAKSIGRANKHYRPTRVSWAGVGIRNIWYTSPKHKRNGRPQRKYPRNYAHLVENGFFHKNSGKFIPGKRPFARAWAQTSPRARSVYLSVLETRILQEVRNLPIITRGRRRR